MLSWLAVHAESGRIERDLEQRSRTALAAAGHDWASVAFSGREGLLVGRPASARQRDDAAALVRDVWGVRTVETRVALSPAAVGLPVASVAAEIAPRSLNDVSPGPVVTATSAELAPAPPNTSHAAPDQAPATTVHARDQAEPAPPAAPMAPIPEQKPAAAINAPAHVETSPPAAAPATRPPEQRPAVAVNAPAHVETSPPAAAPATPPPEQKPAVAVNAPTHAETSPPTATPAAPIPKSAVAVNAPAHVESSPPAAEPMAPVPEQKPAVAVNAPARVESLPPAAAPMAPVPERKPAVGVSAPAHVETSPPAAAPAVPPPPVRKPVTAVKTPSQAAPESVVVAPAPPPPQRVPRFETAALPQSHMGSETDCVGQVRGAAQRVEVHFAHGRAQLDTAGKTLIDGLIGALNVCPGTALHVGGHSDASGQARRNLALSKRRARTVASYMIDKGIDAGRLVAIGYGDTRPVAPNDTQENRAKNRRIEVAITARAAPLPPLPVRKQGTENGLSRR